MAEWLQSSPEHSMTPADFHFLELGLRHVRKSGDLRRTVEDLVRFAAAAAGSSMGSLFMLDSERNVLRPYATTGLPDEYIQACSEVPVGQQCCGRAVLHRMPWIVSDMLSDPLFASNRVAAERSPIRAAFSVPVLNGKGDAIGSLASHFDQPYTPPQNAIERNQVFASLIAYAFARAAKLGQPLAAVASASGTSSQFC